MLWGCDARTGIPGLTIMSPCILFLTIHLLCSGNSAQSQQTQCDSWRLSVALGVIRSLGRTFCSSPWHREHNWANVQV